MSISHPFQVFILIHSKQLFVDVCVNGSLKTFSCSEADAQREGGTVSLDIDIIKTAKLLKYLLKLQHNTIFNQNLYQIIATNVTFFLVHITLL